MKLRWTRTALRQFDRQMAWLARFDALAATRAALEAQRSVGLLKEQPAMGRTGRVPGTRELVLAGTPYVIPYRVRDGAIEVLRFLHASRRPEP